MICVDQNAKASRKSSKEEGEISSSESDSNVTTSKNLAKKETPKQDDSIFNDESKKDSVKSGKGRNVDKESAKKKKGSESAKKYSTIQAEIEIEKFVADVQVNP